PPSVLPDISPARGEIGSVDVPTTSCWRLAKAEATSDLPPCGGDARQGRGGCCPSEFRSLCAPPITPPPSPYDPRQTAPISPAPVQTPAGAPEREPGAYRSRNARAVGRWSERRR